MKPLPITICAWVAVLAIGADSGAAQTTTALKIGERTTGMTKQCYYRGLGNEYTRTISSVAICPLSIEVRLSPSPPRPTPTPQPRVVTAFKTGERITGTTKQCYYRGLGNEYTRTIGSVELCPLSIQVRPGGERGTTAYG